MMVQWTTDKKLMVKLFKHLQYAAEDGAIKRVVAIKDVVIIQHNKKPEESR